MPKNSDGESSGAVPPGRALRQRIDNGEILWGFAVTLPAPGILEVAKDWDWFWIDGQHGQFGYDTILNFARAAELVGVPAIVRVAGHDYSQIGPVLDTGAAGLLIPVIHNAEQAQAVAMAARFPPLGRRSYGGQRLLDRDGPGYSRSANQDTLLLVQIESVEGFDNAEQIAAVAGIDGLFLGPCDYALDRGISADYLGSGWDPHLWEVAEKIARVCRDHGKVATGLIGLPESAGRLIELGYQVLAYSNDALLLGGKLAETLAELRRISKKG